MDDDTLYYRAIDIQDGKTNGLWVPIVQHLALRRHTDAMVVLADRYSGSSEPSADSFGSYQLLRRAWRMGNVHAAQNMAMNCFNDNDVAGFRQWARRADKLGDLECAGYIKRFETRLPHGDARKIGRGRRHAKRDD